MSGLLCFRERRKGRKPGNIAVLHTFFRKNVDFFLLLRIISFCMDIKNADSIVKCDIMAEIRRNNVVVGAKQFKKALRDDRALKAFLAENADPAVTEPIAKMCAESNVPCVWVKTMKELGQVCGIEVGAAAVTAVK